MKPTVLKELAPADAAAPGPRVSSLGESRFTS